MRFDDLFDDLESQLESELDQDAREQAIEDERFRIARLSLHDRLVRGPRALTVRLRHGDRLTIDRLAVGRDWCSGTVLQGAATGDACIVPFTAISGLWFDAEGTVASFAAAVPSSRLAARLSFAFALRDLARRRVAIELRGEHPLTGTIDRVGRDHCDLAVHEAGEARRRSAVVRTELVPFVAIDWVRLPA